MEDGVDLGQMREGWLEGSPAQKAARCLELLGRFVVSSEAVVFGVFSPADGAARSLNQGMLRLLGLPGDRSSGIFLRLVSPRFADLAALLAARGPPPGPLRRGAHRAGAQQPAR